MEREFVFTGQDCLVREERSGYINVQEQDIPIITISFLQEMLT